MRSFARRGKTGAMGDGRWAMGDGRWAMGDGRWAMGDGRWAMGRNKTWRFLVKFLEWSMARMHESGSVKRLVAAAALLLAGCSTQQMMQWAKSDAISKVTRELVVTSNVQLNARFNPWGDGILVYADHAGVADGTRYVWISLQPTNLLRPNCKIPDDTFSLSREAADLTPEIPLLSAASDKVRFRAALANVPWDDIMNYLQTGSARNPRRARSRP